MNYCIIINDFKSGGAQKASLDLIKVLIAKKIKLTLIVFENKIDFDDESGKMKIRSSALISELKTFVASGLSYAAKIGETDDLVMSTVLAVRMMQNLQNYHPEMDQQLRDFGDVLIQPMPFISVMR